MKIGYCGYYPACELIYLILVGEEIAGLLYHSSQRNRNTLLIRGLNADEQV